MNSQPRAWIKRSTYSSEQTEFVSIHLLGTSATPGRDMCTGMFAMSEIQANLYYFLNGKGYFYPNIKMSQLN